MRHEITTINQLEDILEQKGIKYSRGNERANDLVRLTLVLDSGHTFITGHFCAEKQYYCRWIISSYRDGVSIYLYGMDMEIHDDVANRLSFKLYDRKVLWTNSELDVLLNKEVVEWNSVI